MERLNETTPSSKKWIGILLVLVAIGSLVGVLYMKKRKHRLNTEACEMDFLSTEEECALCFVDEKPSGNKDQE